MSTPSQELTRLLQELGDLQRELDGHKNKQIRIEEFIGRLDALKLSKGFVKQLEEAIGRFTDWQGCRLLFPPNPARYTQAGWKKARRSWDRLLETAGKDFSYDFLNSPDKRRCWRVPHNSGDVHVVYGWIGKRHRDHCLVIVWKPSPVSQDSLDGTEKVVRLATAILAGTHGHLAPTLPFANAFRQRYAKYERIRREVAESKTQGTLPEKKFAATCERLVQQLRDIRQGTEDASHFQKAVHEVLRMAFGLPPACGVLEHKLHHGRKRIDLVYPNVCKEGLFHELPTLHLIPCPYILVECKNYTKDPKNPEVDQLLGRFGEGRGRFGILVCNQIRNREKLLRRCQDITRDGRGWIVALDCDDLIAFLYAAALGKAHVWELLDDHFRLLTF